MKSQNPIHVRLEQNHMATTFDLRVSCEASRERQAVAALEDSLRLVKQFKSMVGNHFNITMIS